MLVAGQVTLAGIDDSFAATLDPDDRWNGWYSPLLPREQVERVMAHDDRLRWDGDTVVELLDEDTGDGRLQRGAGLGTRRARLDVVRRMGLTADAVYEALPADCEPIPFRDLCAKLGVHFDPTAPEAPVADVRRMLVALRDDGRAEIVYGRGWQRVRFPQRTLFGRSPGRTSQAQRSEEETK